MSMTPDIIAEASKSEIEQAALKAAGFDRTPKATQIVVSQIAQRYGLRLELRHLIPIEGRPYVTRDGLLHVAHASGQLDGIVLEDEGGDKGGGWWAVVSVYRKDMKHPFKFRGRYNGGNKRFGPEMAVKCAEVMCLRRAFDVAVGTVEERWDVEQSPHPERLAPNPAPPPAPIIEVAAKALGEPPPLRTTDDAKSAFPELGPDYVLQAADFQSRPSFDGRQVDNCIGQSLGECSTWQWAAERNGREQWRDLSHRDRALVIWAHELRGERKAAEEARHAALVVEAAKVVGDKRQALAKSLDLPERRGLQTCAIEELEAMIKAAPGFVAPKAKAKARSRKTNHDHELADAYSLIGDELARYPPGDRRDWLRHLLARAGEDVKIVPDATDSGDLLEPWADNLPGLRNMQAALEEIEIEQRAAQEA